MYKLIITYVRFAQGYAGDDFDYWDYDSFGKAYVDNNCNLYDSDGDYDYHIYAKITCKDKDGYTYYQDMDVDYDD